MVRHEIYHDPAKWEIERDKNKHTVEWVDFELEKPRKSGNYLIKSIYSDGDTYDGFVVAQWSNGKWYNVGGRGNDFGKVTYFLEVPNAPRTKEHHKDLKEFIGSIEYPRVEPPSSATSAQYEEGKRGN
jgi:hypothetical protein